MTSSIEHTRFLSTLAERGGSDLHCKAGAFPSMRIDGALEKVGAERMSAADVAGLATALLTEEQQAALIRTGSVVSAYSAPGVGRFRVAAFRQRGSVAIVMHAIPHEIRRLDDLGLPTAAQSLADLDRGLVLVASPVGNGATTTLAAMVDHVNRTRRQHIVTVDDPIESLHRDEESLVSQLEVGSDVGSLVDGVRSASRVDADVVAVSDIPDRQVAAACLDAVARGRLVFAVLGGETVRNALDGFLELFTFEERPIVRQTFARSLAGVLVQRLIPGRDGLAVVCESMFKTAKIEKIIADEARMDDLPGLLREGVFHGMQTIDQSLKQQVLAGRITEEVALAAAVDAEELRIELIRG